jgi:hypothetical protein
MNGIKKFDFDSPLIGELGRVRHRSLLISETVQLRKYSLNHLTPEQYLSSVESFLSEQLISNENYMKMKNLTSHFSSRITSFFGFETKLDSPQTQADYLFAVSSLGGEREELANLFTNKILPKSFLFQKEWLNIGKFVASWADPHSILYNKVLGLWFEFDADSFSSETPIPCIFIQPPPLRINNGQDIDKCLWITKTALRLLIGHRISEKIENNILQSLLKLPQNAVLCHFGVMLSRDIPGIRLVFNKIHPDQIIPYLTSLGWSDENNKLERLLKEIKGIVSRIVLHLHITEKGIDQKIGLECGYYPDRYNLKTQWEVFINYLIEKNICSPDKKAVLLNFIGVDQEDVTQKFDLSSFQPAVQIHKKDFSVALVRYLSHIKLSYEQDHQIEAKAYLGIRLFGKNKVGTEGFYQ